MLALRYMSLGTFVSHIDAYNRTLLSLGRSVSGSWLCRVTVILWHETFLPSKLPELCHNRYKAIQKISWIIKFLWFYQVYISGWSCTDMCAENGQCLIATSPSPIRFTMSPCRTQFKCKIKKNFSKSEQHATGNVWLEWWDRSDSDWWSDRSYTAVSPVTPSLAMHYSHATHCNVAILILCCNIDIDIDLSKSC